MQIGDKVRVKSYIADFGRRTGSIVEKHPDYAEAWYVIFEDNGEAAFFFESELEALTLNNVAYGTPVNPGSFTWKIVSLDGTVVAEGVNLGSMPSFKRTFTPEELLTAAQGDSLPTQWMDECLDVWITLMANVKEEVK